MKTPPSDQRLPYGVCPKCGAGEDYPSKTRQLPSVLRRVEIVCPTCKKKPSKG